MATVEKDNFGTRAVIGDNGETLGRYAAKKDAQARLRDLQEENSIRMAAATLGARGGAAKTEAKQAASRNNGALGGRPAGTRVEHTTGWNVWLYGERFWHRSLDAAIRRATKATYCNNPQVIDVATGKLVYGNPE
jgi:hypothetical protein